jgi:Fe2+ transport system protein B
LNSAEAGAGHTILPDLRRGLVKGLSTCWLLVKVVFPLYILVNILKDSGALARLAVVFAPAMKYLGLPGEAALALVAGNVGNIYAGLAVMAPLGLAPRQVTIMGLVLGLSHSLIIEGAVFRKMGARPILLSLFRLSVALAAGALVNLVMP